MYRPAATPKAPCFRSAVSNGSRLLIGVDGNTAQARRYRDLVEDLSAEFGPDLSAAELLLVRNAASLQLHAEELTARLVRGETVDPEAITRATNGASRALASLRRRPAKRAARRSVHEIVAERSAAA